MSKTYNVVVNSIFCTSETAGQLNSDKKYYIDWSAIMPQGEYELTFTFISETNSLTSLANLPLIYVDFLSQANIDAVQPGYQATSSHFLGMLYPSVIHQPTDSSILRADRNSNNPIFLVNRPHNNEFRVQVLNNNNPPIPWVDDAVAPESLAPYVLNLHFKLLNQR